MQLGTKKKGELVMNKKEEAGIWKEHFDKLLNTEEPKEVIKTGTKGTSVFDIEEITIEDAEKAINNLRNNKAVELMEYIQN
jgi:hypothetical protein